MDKGKQALLSYGTAGMVGSLIVLGIGLSKDLFSQTQLAETYRILCDGCFTAGVLLAGIGLMIGISNEGTFDILNYGMRSFFGLFSPAARNRKPYGSFQAYRQQRAERRSPFGFLVVMGSLFLIAAVVLNSCFENAL